MTLPLTILKRMVEDGCTAAQLYGAIEAEHDFRAERRAACAARRTKLSSSFIIEEEPISSPSAPPNVGPRDTGKKAEARLALLTMPGLSPTARRVGAFLVESCNLTTGQCDPSHGRIIEKAGLAVEGQLMASAKRIVRRAVTELVVAKVIARVIHGSYSHRNAYTLKWAALSAAARASENAPKMNEADSIPLRRTILSAEEDNFVPQNLREKPSLRSELVVSPRRLKRPDPDQPQMLLPSNGGRHIAKSQGVPMAIAVEESIKRRLSQAIFAKYSGRDNPFLNALTAHPEVMARALGKEREKPGSGVPYLEFALSAATGPPMAASG